MKLTIEQLRHLVMEEINEAKKKSKKKAPEKKDVATTGTGYKKDDLLDMSKPLGDKNLYKRQGASNFGPYTAESALRLFIRECLKEAVPLSEKKIGFKKLKNALAKKADAGKKKAK